jgi:MFS family permease
LLQQVSTPFYDILPAVQLTINLALPAIAQDFKATSNAAYWCGTGFLFAQAASQPVYGSISNAFGRKVCLLFALTLFIVASVFCATAQSITWLIVARLVKPNSHLASSNYC